MDTKDGRWPRLWEIFHEALEKPAPERAGFLEATCAGDAGLRCEVEELLAAHEASGGKFLSGDSAGGPLADPAERALGARIGRYRLVSIIGEGGMGVVYQAEQEEPIRRRVALKLIKVGMDTREVVARFESERQALALMSHANIAHVLDGGATEEGRPYFVMELVLGVPITEYADRQRLTVRERLELFLPVCHAVQHAHQKGIIHRDIKPANVLVSLEEGKPVPKVIDFGVAKAIEQRLTERSLYTEQGRILGTPEYMSPEQAEMGPDIDTRTDIYSLGVLLYEILTGSLPFDFRNASYTDIQRKIRSEDPPRPSARLSVAGEELDGMARDRGTDRASLRREVKGELDWIVMKALEKDRALRYATASELAADLERSLRHEPIQAGPPTATYRIKKFVRRHKIGVAATAAIAVLLVGFGITMSFQSARIARALRRADLEREKAERVSTFLVDLFRVSDPSEARGNTVSAREILDRGSSRIAAELQREPEVQAALMETMGRVYRNLGLYGTATSLLERTLEVRRRAFGERNETVARSLLELGVALERKGDLDRAETLLEEALAIQRSVLGEAHGDVADTLHALGIVRHTKGDYSGAENRLRRALAIRKALPGDQSAPIAQTLARLGGIAQSRGDFAGAERLYREALETNRRTQGPDHPDTLAVQLNVASALHRQGKYEESERHHREVLGARKRVLGPEHPEVAVSLNGLAAMLYDKGDAAAESVYREALAIQRKALGSEHPDVARTLNNLGLALQEKRDWAGAEGLYGQALAINRRLFGQEHWTVGGNLNNLGLMFHEKGDYSRAEDLFRQALAMHRKLFGGAHPSVGFGLNNLARLLNDKGDLAAAEPLYRQGLALRRKALRAGHPEIAASLTGLGRLLNDQGAPSEAEPLLREALAIRRQSLAPQDWRIFETEGYLGASFAGLGRFTEAEPLLSTAYRRIRDRRGETDLRTRQARERLADFYRRAGHKEKLAVLRAEPGR